VVQVLEVLVAKNGNEGRGRHRTNEAAVGSANTKDRDAGADRCARRLLTVRGWRDDIGVVGSGKLSDRTRSEGGHDIADLSHPDKPAILIYDEDVRCVIVADPHQLRAHGPGRFGGARRRNGLHEIVLNALGTG
jgi:hypothetical protein